MPRYSHALPKYRRRRGRRYKSGRREVDQAVVTISGIDHYLGPYGTTASKTEYDRLIAEWLAAGRSMPSTPSTMSVAELSAAYWKFAKGYYQKRGKCTKVAPALKCALRYVLAWYADEPVSEFGPLKLKAIREQMVADNHSRKYINDHIDRIKRMFRWGVSEELVNQGVYERLKSVSRLRRGKSAARETSRILPVEDVIVEQTLPYLSPVVADMVQLQRLLSARPGEICELKPADVDQEGDVWLFRPTSYKTEHLHETQGERVLFIGPKAQQILSAYLERDDNAFCFQPKESEEQRRRFRHEQRATPLKCGNRPGTNRSRSPKRSAGDCYTTDSYRRAIHRACDLAFPAPDPLGKRENETKQAWTDRLTTSQQAELRTWQASHRWSPNQLRHSAATQLRSEFGAEAARVMLGHSNLATTEIYAERDLKLGVEIAKSLG